MLTKTLDTSTWLCGPPPAKGQYQRYPGRFIYNLKNIYLKDGMHILEMFSGSSDLGGVTTDLREETGCDIACPFNDIPLPNNTFDLVLADPPYNIGFANVWTTHKEDLPKPKHILREASRLTKPGGLILILHVIIIPAYKAFRVSRIALHPILTGPNNAIRVLNVFRKQEPFAADPEVREMLDEMIDD